MTQGGYLIGEINRLESSKRLVFLDQEVSVDENGKFIIGFGRDFPEVAELKVLKNSGEEVLKFAIAPREYRIERIDGLPPKKVNPTSKEVLDRIRKDSSEIRLARKTISSLPYFADTFKMPAQGRISGYYGSQRILNGDPKRPHFGQDIAAPVGTPVYAPASGKVTLAHTDMFYSGATIIIDHGYGLNSTYLHLNSISVKVGQQVKQGEQIGTIGESGRATGPHLDWRINWLNQRLDPALFVE